jgi:hypothetical protein
LANSLSIKIILHVPTLIMVYAMTDVTAMNKIAKIIFITIRFNLSFLFFIKSDINSALVN